jgi:hypothetical protein
LPSAGIIPLLQSFCQQSEQTVTAGQVDENGFIQYPSARINGILQDIADISETPLFHSLANMKSLTRNVIQLSRNPNLVPDAKRTIVEFRLSDVLQKRENVTNNFETFLSQNLTMPSDLIGEFVDDFFIAHALSHMLLEKNYELFQTFLSGGKDISLALLPKLKKAILLQAMFDPKSLLEGPIWTQLVFQAALPELMPILLTANKNPNAMENMAMNILFTADFIQTLSSCGDVMNGFFTIQREKKRYTKLQTFLCNLSKDQSEALVSVLIENLNWTVFHDKISHHSSLVLYKEYALTVQELIHELNEIENAYSKMCSLARKFYVNMTEIEAREKISPKSKATDNINHMWKILYPFLCHEEKLPKMNQTRTNSTDDDFSEKREPNIFSSKSIQNNALKIMLYALTNNPLLLYAPNGTEVDQVVTKASHYLKLLKDTEAAAQKWIGFK